MKKVLVPALIITILYFLATTYFMNSRLALDTLTGNYPVSYKLDLTLALILGMWSAMGAFGLMILLITAGLTGLNLSILGQRIGELSKTGNMHFVVGGSSVLGLATSGCAACGLPILALFGISGSLLYLPFRGLELSFLSIVLLTISLVALVKTRTATECRINSNV